LKSSKKILILKLGAIGDVVMASSLITAIDEKYPRAEITWICGKNVEQILAGFNRINTLIAIDEILFYKGNLLNKFKIIVIVWNKLFGKRFDIVLNCYRDKKYKLLLLPAMSKKYLDFSGKTAHNTFIPGRYHSDEYSRMILTHNDWKIVPSSLPIISISGNSGVDSQIKNQGMLRIILAPGGAVNILRQDDLRRWQIEKYVELTKELINKNFSVVLTGSENDSWASENFSNLKITDLIGKTSLLDLIYLFNKSSVIVSHDTGILHLAKLSSIKIIALFGPVNPKERIGVKENVEVIWGGINLPCSPCYDGKNFADCNNNICMKNISVNDVLNKITDIIEKNNH
jgi:heptosyltransferase-2